MSTRKKRFILGLTGGVMALGLVGVIVSQNTFKIGIGVHAEDPNNILWKHYAAVEASPIMHGSKEFWANCSELGTHIFTQPTTGKTEEGGDFGATNYFTELDSTDGRYVGYEETTTYYEGWNKNDFVFTDNASLPTVSQGFDTICWSNGSVNQELKTQYMAQFGKTDNDGWMMSFGSNGTEKGTITLPKTDFSSLLDGGKIARIEIGGYNTWNNINLFAGGKTTQIHNNQGDQSIACLTRISLTFYKDLDNNVHLHYIDTLNEKPCSDASKYGEIILTAEEANGTSSLVLSTTQAGNNSRRYWLGKLRFTNGERVYKDFSAKTGFTATGAGSYTFAEAKTKKYNPHGQVYESIHPTDLAVGICGTSNGSATLALDKINYKELLDNNEGIYFTIGAWNGGEYISFVNQGKEVNLGLNAAKPDNPANHTKESIKSTWKNWQIAINKTGMHVYNVFENTYTTFTLTSKQLNGEESLEFKLAKQSNDRFFLLTNMMTYHI